MNVNKDGCAQEDVFDNLISKKLNEFRSEEKTGPKIKVSLAKMVNSLLPTQISSGIGHQITFNSEVSFEEFNTHH